MKKQIRLVLTLMLISSLAVAALLGFFQKTGIVRLNKPSEERFPVRGVDVSSYQGEIDWQVLARENLQFAFIKATEGSGHVDNNFAKNYQEAQKTKLRVGAYHFFSFESGGDTQAANFIATVPKSADMLPPVVDVEFYGDTFKNPPDREAVQRELTVMLEKLQAHYGKTPILYTTGKAYDRYLAGGYSGYGLWIRNVISMPWLPAGQRWDFWQYDDKQKLPGYSGPEPCIDMNVFHGTAEEFAAYGDA